MSFSRIAITAGATSTVEWTINRVSRVANQSVFTRLGTVSAGFGAGHQATSTSTFIDLDLNACATTGVVELAVLGSYLRGVAQMSLMIYMFELPSSIERMMR